MIYSASINFHKHYTIDHQTFTIDLKSETYHYDSEKNIYTRYYFNDTIVIKKALNNDEYNTIVELVHQSKVFNFDSIYIIPNPGIIISLPSTKTELRLKDKNRDRHFILNSEYYDNKLSTKKDFIFVTELIEDINKTINESKNIRSLPKSDLAFY